MTLIVAKGLPAASELAGEGIVFAEDLPRCSSYLKILILNLMPTKTDTERQLLRLLGQSGVTIQVDFIHLTSPESKNVSKEHLSRYYTDFSKIKDKTYDGLIITGAPVEHLPFEDVNYYDELKEILEWSRTHVSQRLFICWAAQFALNQLFQLNKLSLNEKLFGVFDYHINDQNHPYTNGFQATYSVPQSRHTSIAEEDIRKIAELDLLSRHPNFGPDIIATKDKNDLFVFGHLEYESDTLQKEYERDLSKGEAIKQPKNSQVKGTASHQQAWKNASQLLWSNWIQYIYQMK